MNIIETKFEKNQRVRTRHSLPNLNIPQYTLGFVITQTEKSVHVRFPGDGICILTVNDIESAPGLAVLDQSTVATDLTAYKRDDGKLPVGNYVSEREAHMYDSDHSITLNRGQLWRAYISTVSFQELCNKLGLK